jgi:hypothetical protein
MSLARTPDGAEYQGTPGFDYDSHDRWVRAGHCPVVSIGGSWCNKPPHDGPVHGSVNVPAENRGQHFVEWEM